jgi:endoglucanase
MLEAPNEGDWGLYVQEEYFDLIKDAGFDFVRLPVRWSGHADKSSPYALDSVFLSRVDQVVGWALARNLLIIIDFHNYQEISENPGGERDRFLGIWKQLAEHYKGFPLEVMFELLNEPNNLFAGIALEPNTCGSFGYHPQIKS